MGCKMRFDDECFRRRIREEVLRGIARNRVPGYHFAGNYFGTAFESINPEGAIVQLDPDIHSSEPDGSLHIGALALLADVAMGASIRARLHPAVRLATTSMQLQFSGVAPKKPLEASAACNGFVHGAIGQHAMSNVLIRQSGEEVCRANAVFMVVPAPGGRTLPPFPWRRRDELQIALPDVDTLDEEEGAILARVDAILASMPDWECSFVRRFLGYETVLENNGATSTMLNGPHVGNRVGHVQGGILVGLAAVTAHATLSENWGLTSLSASFMRPGEGKEMHAHSCVVHRGRHTAMLRTEVFAEGKLILDVMTTHAALA
jgi:acyl-coenzyme A thioesterase PaaI-like protein